MRSYTITLTSNQLLTIPAVLDHYLFLDPISGTNFTYPASADDSDYFYSTGQPTITADDGGFVPWGYGIQDIITNLNVGPLKGPYTVNFSPLGLDTSVYSILKIDYDFGDGSQIITTNYNFKPTYTQGESLTAVPNPRDTIVSHNYYPVNSGMTVYTPSITAYNGNLTTNVFNISISSIPISIYDLADIHLINNTQQLTATETQNIFEIESPNYLTVARLLSTSNIIAQNTVPFYPSSYNDLLLWLDASDIINTYKQNYGANNIVTTWKDKSGNGNDFISDNLHSTPLYKYPRQSQSNRRCLSFNGQYLSNYTITQTSSGQGYTLFIVGKLNSPNGTIFSHNTNTVPDTNISISSPSPYTLNIGQGSVNTTSISNLSYNLTGYSLFSFTLQGSGSAYFTLDNLTIQRNNQNYTYNKSVLPVFIGDPSSTTAQDIEISELILYSTPLSIDAIQRMQQYLINKWQLTLQSN